MNIVDLHVHSNKSDGSFSPTELVEIAVSKGLSAFALTDHDTTEGIEEALLAARSYNLALKNDLREGKPLEVIPGIEFSTEYMGKDVHIIGLFIDYESPVFQEKIQEFVNARTIRNRKMCEGLASAGIDITYEKLLEEFPCCIITRSHYARYLLNHGYTTSMAEAFERYIGDHAPYFVPKEKITPVQAVELIHQVNGIAILAHPILYRLSKQNLDQLVKSLKEAGLTGIEAVYSTYTQGEEAEIRKLASKYDLVISGGSDFHGTIKPKLEMATGYGKLFIPEEILDKLKEARQKKYSKILFTDLDGTLLRDDKTISSYTYRILEEWCRKGNRLVLCSGRALDSILKVFKDLNLSFPNVYLVGCNGGEIYDCSKKQLLLRRTLPFPIVQEIFSIAEKYNIHIQTYSETHIITKKDSDELKYYRQVIHTPALITEDVFSHLEKEPCKCLAIELRNLEGLEAFRTEVIEKLGRDLSVIYSNANYIELFPADSGKGSSIHWLCNYLNLPVSNSLAAGDEMNDVSMIQTAGIGIAMCNGRKEVQEQADVITFCSNNEDGLAKLLEKQL